SLAAVADQYLEQVRVLVGNLDILSEFLVVASQLLVIKSRALLPAPPLTDVQDDPAEELQRRLAEYQILRVAALWLQEREAIGGRSWPRGPELPSAARLLPLAPLDAARLAALAALHAPAVQQPAVASVPPRLSLRERADVLLARLSPETWTALEEF